MKITAVIPIRKGSERVKEKNMKPFADTNLLELKINALKQVKSINEIIVNTDSELAIEIAKANGVSFHKREDYYASSICTNSEFLQHLGLVTDTDIFAYCPCTTPFIEPLTIEEGIMAFLKDEEHDSLATVSIVKEFLWHNNNPINYERGKQPNSQNLPNIYALNFGLNLISRENLIKYKNIVGLNPIFKVTNGIEKLDIDTPLDFFLAEQIFCKIKENPIYFK
jgi:N-acylneuraminate cytidylyltransferase